LSIRLEATSNRGSFKLFRLDDLICDLQSVGWPSCHAITEYNNQKIEIKPRSIFQRGFDILKDGKVVGEVTMNWFDHIRINLTRADGSGSDRFVLKSGGFIKKQYDLLSSNQRLLSITSKFNWFGFYYSYDVEEYEHRYPDEILNELLIYAGFASNLSHARSRNN